MNQATGQNNNKILVYICVHNSCFDAQLPLNTGYTFHGHLIASIVSIDIHLVTIYVLVLLFIGICMAECRCTVGYYCILSVGC